MATRKKKARRSAAQRAATRNMLAAARARRSTSTGGTRMRKRKRATTASNPRRRRRSGHRKNPVLLNPRRGQRRRGRRVRRNPPATSISGVTGIVIQGVQDAMVLTTGKAVSNIIAGYIPAFFTTKDANGVAVETTMGKTARKLIAATAVGVIARVVFKAGNDTARFAVAGALAAPLEEFIRPLIAGVPVIGTALSSYPLAGTRRIAAYAPPRRPVAAYQSLPAPRGNAGGVGARAMANNQAFYAGQGG
jgi:hypothetical protein